MIAERYARLVDALSGDGRVRLVYAFGSAARGAAAARSDLDVAVLLDRAPSLDEEVELRTSLAERVSEVDVVILNGAPPVLRYEVITGGRCLLARDEAEQAEFEISSLSRFLDFQPMRRVQQEYLRARVAERRGSQSRSAS